MFDFLGTDELRRESELEQKLMDHLEKFLMELGQGFAFVGRQVHMEVGKDDCYIDRIRDDIEGLTMDAESIFELTEKEQAKKLNLSLMGKIREKSDPRFEELGKRLERLKEKYEAGVLSSLEWLKDLLDAAKAIVRMEHDTNETIIPDDKQALTQIFLELKNSATPRMIANIVEDIDKIVRATRFDGWQHSITGERDIQKVLRQTLFRYKLHTEQALFEKAYAYIREHY